MVGLWEGVPASPCSGASDEVASRPSTRYSRRTRAKRSRAAARVEANSVGFVDPKSQDKAGKDSALVNKLNSSAADERRKILLAKLRVIDQRKAALKASASASSSRETLAGLVEAATPEPYDGESAPSPNSIQDLTVHAKPANLTLDVSAATPFGRASPNVNNFYSNGSPSASTNTIFGSPLPSPSARSPSVSYADLPTRRGSRRTSRPRTPNVLLNGMPGETVLKKLPVGVLKCKRYNYCKKIISFLLKNPSAAPFSAPVKELWKPEAIPRYFDVISRPMDLGTIKKNLEGTEYLNMEESNALFMFKPDTFANDVRQVFRNARIYNRTGDVLYNCASDLMDDFEAMFKNVPEAPSKDGNSRKRQAAQLKNGVQCKRGRLGDLPPSCRPRPNASAPKSPIKLNGGKPAGPNGRTIVLDEDMTPKALRKRLDYLRKCIIALRSRRSLPRGANFYDRAALLHEYPPTEAEKKDIFKGIEKLPAAKQGVFLEIVGKSEDDDEVEIDVTTFDTKTLRNVEAYLEVTLPNYKTIRNSTIGTEFTSPDEFEDEIQLIEKRLAECAKKPKTARKTTPPAIEPVVCMATTSTEETDQLYASSDEEDDSDSDSDSSGSDSETE